MTFQSLWTFTYTFAPSSTTELQYFHRSEKCLMSPIGSLSLTPVEEEVAEPEGGLTVVVEEAAAAVVEEAAAAVVLCHEPFSPIPRYTLSPPDSWRGSNTATPIWWSGMGKTRLSFYPNTLGTDSSVPLHSTLYLSTSIVWLLLLVQQLFKSYKKDI